PQAELANPWIRGGCHLTELRIRLSARRIKPSGRVHAGPDDLIERVVQLGLELKSRAPHRKDLLGEAEIRTVRSWQSELRADANVAFGRARKAVGIEPPGKRSLVPS